MNAIAVFIGGGLGSLARYGISVAFRQFDVHQLPIATLSANLLSVVLLSFIVLRTTSPFESWYYSLIVIGFCGGFSTFSTFSFETFSLIRTGDYWWAIANVIVSTLSCLLIIYLVHRISE